MTCRASKTNIGKNFNRMWVLNPDWYERYLMEHVLISRQKDASFPPQKSSLNYSLTFPAIFSLSLSLSLSGCATHKQPSAMDAKRIYIQEAQAYPDPIRCFFIFGRQSCFSIWSLDLVCGSIFEEHLANRPQRLSITSGNVVQVDLDVMALLHKT
jgi:hypothetical protein